MVHSSDNLSSRNWKDLIKMVDVKKAKSDLATYIKADYSIPWAVAKVVADYRLWNYVGRGNAWIDSTMRTYEALFPPHSRHIYI